MICGYNICIFWFLGSSRNPVEDNNGVFGNLYITEIEQIFGFPKHYTDVGDISVLKRQQLLGRAWSVPVVQSICDCLKDIFQLKEENSSE